MRGRPNLTATMRARQLRRNQTDVEQRLWRALRARSFGGAKFRRQLPIGRHVVDFACPSRRLIVELDGGQHAAQASGDEARSRMLAAHGYRVIRFWNNDVNENLPGVLAAIESVLADPSPQPSPRSRGAREPAGVLLLSLPSGREQDGNASSYPRPLTGGEGRVRGCR